MLRKFSTEYLNTSIWDQELNCSTNQELSPAWEMQFDNLQSSSRQMFARLQNPSLQYPWMAESDNIFLEG